EILLHAVIVDEAEDLGKVSIGSRVTVVRLSDEAVMTYNIVGSQEANVMEKKISEDSPFGKALMGAKEGD
ncbi:GreA/GreB family elongation factor, partial [Klebsiella pneumoniae]|uniref:GreA/GreB family elongation factor n=1 Tax=Klebsiella pneumoniae TaxID=573 RepID=UPI0025A2B764